MMNVVDLYDAASESCCTRSSAAVKRKPAEEDILTFRGTSAKRLAFSGSYGSSTAERYALVTLNYNVLTSPTLATVSKHDSEVAMETRDVNVGALVGVNQSVAPSEFNMRLVTLSAEAEQGKNPFDRFGSSNSCSQSDTALDCSRHQADGLKCNVVNNDELEEKDGEKDQEAFGRKDGNDDGKGNAIGKKGDAAADDDDEEGGNVGEEKEDREGNEGDEGKGEDKEGEDTVNDDEDESEEEEKEDEDDKKNEEANGIDSDSGFCTSAVLPKQPLHDRGIASKCRCLLADLDDKFFYGEEYANCELKIYSPYKYSRRSTKRGQNAMNEAERCPQRQVSDMKLPLSRLQDSAQLHAVLVNTYDQEYAESEVTISLPYKYSKRSSKRDQDVIYKENSGFQLPVSDGSAPISCPQDSPHVQSAVTDSSGQISSDVSKDQNNGAIICCSKTQISPHGSHEPHSFAHAICQVSPEIFTEPSNELNTSHDEMQRSSNSQESSDASKNFSCVSPKQPTQSSGIKLKIKLPKEEISQVINSLSNGTNGEATSNENEEMTRQLPTSAKALLLSGLLEGCRVHYQYRGHGIMLTGVVKGGGILCDCKICKGQTIVNISSFEKHAGSNARHPSDYIFLENGKSLQEVIRTGWQTSQVKYNGTIHSTMFSTDGEANGCRKRSAVAFRCKDASPNTGLMQQRVDADSAKSPQIRQSSQARDGSRHKMIFLPGGLPDGTEVSYYVKGQCFLTGVKMGHGIRCSCCDEVVSCSQFEAHAGWASRRNAYISIFLSNGQSLHEYAVTLAVKLQNASQERSDFCVECGDSGDLIACNFCVRAYHAECTVTQNLIGGNWCCPVCENQITQQCKKNIRCNNRAPNSSSAEKRCQRIVKVSENTIGGCVFCKNGDFLRSGFGAKTIILCDQCEREYHVGCMKENGFADLQELPPGEWFCCNDCNNIHNVLEEFVCRGPEPVKDDVFNIIVKKKYQNETICEQMISQRGEFSWQLLHGRRGDPKNRRTLSEAANIFAESFDPIIDATSGRDLISLMVYSQSIRDQDFRGMYCAVLRWKEQVVSAAVIRIFGRKFAEMPLIATSTASRGQGYFQMLMASIEGLLRSLQVEYLVLPATEEATGIWTKFGFLKLQDAQLQQFGSEVQMMIFQGSSMLFKSIT